jgi:hypothetical protein
MTDRPATRSLSLLLALSLTSIAWPAFAQAPAPQPVPAAQPARSQAEQNVFNLPTTQPLRRFGHHFRITHRFARNLLNGSLGLLAGDLFGLDAGAVIGLDYRFSPMTNVQLGVYRSMLLKTIQVSGRYDVWPQAGAAPVALSVVGSVEGTNNLRDNRAPGLGVVASRTIGTRLVMYATPMFVWNASAVHDDPLVVHDHAEGHEEHDHGLSTLSPFDDGHRHTAFVGVGSRMRLLTRTFVVLEYAPRVAGHSPTGRGVWGFGIEQQTGGHLFQINLSNSFGTTYGQTALGGERSNVYLGFNLARRW